MGLLPGIDLVGSGATNSLDACSDFGLLRLRSGAWMLLPGHSLRFEIKRKAPDADRGRSE